MNVGKHQPNLTGTTVQLHNQVSNDPKLTPQSTNKTRHSFDVADSTSNVATNCSCFSKKKSSKVQDIPTNPPPLTRTRSVTHPARFTDEPRGTLGTIKKLFKGFQRPSRNQSQESQTSHPKDFESPVPGAWQEQTEAKERKRFSEEDVKRGELGNKSKDDDLKVENSKDDDLKVENDGMPQVENFGDENDFYQQFGLRAGEQHRRFEILRPSDQSIPEENEHGSTEEWDSKNLTPRSREGIENETKKSSEAEAYDKLEDSPPASPTSTSPASTKTSLKARLSNLALRVSSHLPFSKAKPPTDKVKTSDHRTGMVSLGNGKMVQATLQKKPLKKSIFNTMTLAAKTILSKKNLKKSNTSSTVAQIPKTSTPFNSLSVEARDDIEKWMKNLQEEDKEAINKWLKKHPNISLSEFTGEIFSELCEISCVKPIFSWPAPEFCGLEKADIELLPILLSLRELFVQNNTDETSNKAEELLKELKKKIEELKKELQEVNFLGKKEKVSVWSQFNIGGPDKLKLENLDNVDQELIRKMCNEIISMDRSILVNNSGKHLNLLMDIMKNSV